MCGWTWGRVWRSGEAGTEPRDILGHQLSRWCCAGEAVGMGGRRIITGRGRIEEGQVWESDLGQGG